MGKKGKGGAKVPVTKVSPGAHEPRQNVSPTSYLAETPVWRFSQFDWEGPWGLTALNGCSWYKHISQHLAGFETMAWREILSASGGKREGNGTNSHPIPVPNLSPGAQGRLNDLRIKAESVFSLRLEACVRIYGLQEGRVLKMLWFDPFHDNKDRAVCPSTRN